MMTCPALGREKLSLFSLLAPLHVSSQLRCSFFFQCPCTVGEPRGPPRPFLPQRYRGLGRRSVSERGASRLLFLLCYRSAMQPATSGERERQQKQRKEGKKRIPRQHQHSNKYCSSQIGITLCLGCIELDLAS